MMVSSPRDPNFLPNVPIVNDDDDEDPQEPIDPPADRSARNNSVPPFPDFSHPDTPGPSRSVPIFDDAIPDPTTENQPLNAAAYIPNEPSLPQQNSNEIPTAPAEPEHNDDTSNLPAEPQQPSSSNAPTEPQQQQLLVQDDPIEPEQEDPANNDPFDPQSTEPEANASSHSNQSSHPSDPN
jgi:hypothetical protein